MSQTTLEQMRAWVAAKLTRRDLASLIPDDTIKKTYNDMHEQTEAEEQDRAGRSSFPDEMQEE